MMDEDLDKAKFVRFISIVIFISMVPLITCGTIEFLYYSPDSKLTMVNIFGELQQIISTLEKYGLPAQWLIDISPRPSMQQILNRENVMFFGIITAILLSGIFWVSTQIKINKVNAFIAQAEYDLKQQFNKFH